ncbi:BREX-1 system adenine-specific DNA-methyltransferase PglX [Peribacillus frigoritolerans]|uniref:BREX-1 system adenine-specific DNA-methyltransferase PglX n=1 Tax=Peribacillus frigoritolerans TaxID=450367 RepID=UPI0021AA81D1|nr:BREX-1 system adenine-specific DNA-methyltransferase PglX [Peribacillus frigoritolerans]MCT4479107.1 BREX-1 system adenine-specific DNA-methyltransferase PglX [Peribacillus frigoritolerans]
MNKRALKEFAMYARNELRRQIALRAATFGVTSKGCATLHTGSDYVEVNNEKYDLSYKKSFEKLFHEVETKGYDYVIEEVAYTWFNRLVALRYMEVHDYLPSRIRVLSSETKGKIDPDLLTEYRHADLPEKIVNDVSDLLHNGHREQAYRKLLVAQCNELHMIMPFLFEKVTDYTELLLPESLLHSDSFINKLGQEMEESNFREVEVIGWLYQYYISEKKNEIFEGLRKNKKIIKENIPAATQLFTPHWIVRYMVENSVGQLWLESHPESDLKKDMTYYVEPAEQEENVQRKLDELSNSNLRPEEITVLDPACGSGHILVYAFDLLYKIYEERGYSLRDIPTLIIEKNLYGIEIDDRAAQLASFALLMKAREKSKRIFRNPPKLNVISIQESNELPIKAISEVLSQTEGEEKEVQAMLREFIDAKNYGSILQPEKLDYDKYLVRIEDMQSGAIQMSAETFEVYERTEELMQLFLQGKLLSSQYNVVITNPPYMGAKGMNPKLSEYVKKYYKDSKSDLFAIFMERCFDYTKENGYHAEINQHSWMFLSSYEKLRKKLLDNQVIASMIHLGTRTFEEIGGEVVQSTSYVMRKSHLKGYFGKYKRLVSYSNYIEKEYGFLNDKKWYIIPQNYFQQIPGMPVAYWASKELINAFTSNDRLENFSTPTQGMTTSDNRRFLRLWFEVNKNKIGLEISSLRSAKESRKKWFPYNKGGSFRKWYGNHEYLVNWENDGEELKKWIDEISELRPGGRIKNKEYYFLEGLTWSKVTSSCFSVRYMPKGFIFADAGCSIFDLKGKTFELLGLLNSKVTFKILECLSPTLNFEVTTIKSIPVTNRILDNNRDLISNLSKECIDISICDWNSFESSWDFKKHPYLTYRQNTTTLEMSFKNWSIFAQSRFHQLQSKEEELNRIFIDLYGLQDELTPEVPDNEITIRLADRVRDVKSFLSYCVGLMMGRYSLDVEGLVYAGGEWDSEKYKTFTPDDDGILPLTESVYFEDDVVSRLQDILVTIFGAEHLAENLRWLAESLTMKSSETPVERLRRYFFDEFYKDHCQVYSKRPIYWMIDSGKKKGFRALVYLHRYNTETLAKVRFQYVQDLQEKLRAEQRRLEQDLVNPDLTTAMKKRYEKQLTTNKIKQEELVSFDKKLAELANQRIALDLDDGVVMNYAKLQDVLGIIK